MLIETGQLKWKHSVKGEIGDSYQIKSDSDHKFDVKISALCSFF